MSDDILGGLHEKLLAQGWHITPAGLELITDNGRIKDLKILIKNALDTDLKDVGQPTISEMLHTKKVKNVVVQIQKIRNIAAPKANEDSQAAPRMLKLIVTDGHTYCQAIERENIQSLSLHKTPPGSKLLLKGATILSGYILISSSSCTNLGGRVSVLYDKWELNRNIINCKRGEVDGEGPPPWVNFGTKISPLGGEDTKNFKSLETKVKDDKPSEFDLQRQDAITEAASGAIKKVFGGGTKIVPPQYEKRSYDNNRNNHQQSYDRKPNENSYNNGKSYDNNSKPFENRGGRKGRREPREKPEEKQQRPSDKVSLFSFLEDKLPVNSKTSNSNPPIVQQYNPPTTTTVHHHSNSTNNSYNDKYGGASTYNNPKPSFMKPKPNQTSYKPDKPVASNEKAPRFNNNTPKPTNNDKVDAVTQNMSRLNINASFATKAFKQHLNLPSSNKNDSFGGPKFDKKYDSSGAGKFDNGSQYKYDQKYDNAPHQKYEQTYDNAKYEASQQNHEKRYDNHAKKYDNSTKQTYGKKYDNGSQLAQNDAFYKDNKPAKMEPVAAKTTEEWLWHVGDQCMAKYWEDNKYYNASITGLTERTCVIKFNDYGNMEEVLKTDCIPISDPNVETHLYEEKGNKSGAFRQGGSRNYFNRSYNRTRQN